MFVIYFIYRSVCVTLEEHFRWTMGLGAILEMDLGEQEVGGETCHLVVTSKWRRQWHPTPVLLSGKSHGRRSLVGCSPWGREESDMTESTTHTHALGFMNCFSLNNY